MLAYAMGFVYRVLSAVQVVLVKKIADWRGRHRLTFVFDATKSSWHIVSEILGKARETGNEGAVARHLVGAKLQLRYPQVAVENFSFNASGAQQRRLGDFFVGDTAFHVTVSPMAGVYDRCDANLDAGHRVCLIVPDRSLVGVRQNAEAASPGGSSSTPLRLLWAAILMECRRSGRQTWPTSSANCSKPTTQGWLL